MNKSRSTKSQITALLKELDTGMKLIMSCATTAKSKTVVFEPVFGEGHTIILAEQFDRPAG